MIHPISHYVSYDKFSANHKAYLMSITSYDEPKHFSHVVKDPRWREAMKQEIHALESNKTCTLEQLPPGKKVVDSKWDYKVKYKPNGEVERLKARLVAKGFTQIEGVDFHETFAPVTKLVIVQTLLPIDTKRNWFIHQLDVKNMILHGDIYEEAYMRIPQGFAKNGDTRVCKLRKSIYGLRQASQNWYHKFTHALTVVGFKQSKADHSLFTYRQGEKFVSSLIYDDDVILAGNDKVRIQSVKRFMDAKFSIKDVGPLKYFFGIK